MKNKEIHSMDREELEKKHAELKKELIKLNTQVATRTSLKSPGKVGQTKKFIAKILAKLHMKKNRGMNQPNMLRSKENKEEVKPKKNE